MKICDISCLYGPRGGGIKTYIDSKRSVYKTRNIAHVLIAPNTNNKKTIEKQVDGSLTVYYVPVIEVSFGGVLFCAFRRFQDIREIIKMERPDVLEIGDKITTLLFKRKIRKLAADFNVKVFAFSHERADNYLATVLGSRFLGSPIARVINSRFVGATDAIIANSDFTAGEIISSSRVHVLKLGIDVADFSREKNFDPALYKKISDNGRKAVLVHVGRLDHEKKIDLLTDFAKELDANKYTLLVVGGGGCEHLVKSLPAVWFTGYVPHDEVRKYLAVSDVGVLVNDIEPYGLVGLEMMAMSLVILGPNAGGLTSFLKKDFAWLLSPNKKAYLSALDEWQNLSLIQKENMGRAACAEAQNYTLEKMVDDLLEIYKQRIVK